MGLERVRVVQREDEKRGREGERIYRGREGERIYRGGKHLYNIYIKEKRPSRREYLPGQEKRGVYT